MQPSSTGIGPVSSGPPTRIGRWHPALQGECISSIAKDTGHFWHTIWNQPANAALKSRRGDPNVLLPGDAVFVPTQRPKEEPGSTDQHHRFRRKGEPAWLRIAFKRDDLPRSGEPYVVEIDGKRFEGALDADGLLQCPIPGNARRGRLILGSDPETARIYELALGELDPVAGDSGMEARLNHLGLWARRKDRPSVLWKRSALERFQRRNGLPVTGDADAATRQRLQELHGT
jgi:N-acetylmuramoyl-L-alanine amidase